MFASTVSRVSHPRRREQVENNMVTLTDAQVAHVQNLLAQIGGFLASTVVVPAGIPVAAGSDLQAAINAAPAGSTLLIAPSDYAPVTIPKPLHLISTASQLGRRVAVTDDPGLFWRIGASGVPALTATAPVTCIGLHAMRGDINPPVVSITGDWSTGAAQLVGCWVLASALGNRRGIEANGCATLISQSRIENIWFQGQDAQAVSGWTGPGPLTIDDCYLEASTQAVMLGGDDAVDQAHQPQNFMLKNSLLTKQLAWRTKTGLVKTTLELKNCVGFTVQDNTIEYAWVDGQVGFLLQLTPRNQNGGNPWATVSNGVIQRNVFQHGAGGINILGTDNNHPSGRCSNVKILHNTFADIDPTLYGGNGRLVQLVTGPDGITIDHNTLVGAHGNSFLSFGNNGDTLKSTNFVFTNNIASEGDYGIAGDNTGQGVAALATYAPGAVVTNNAIIQGGARTIPYPAGNTILPPGTAVTAVASPTTDGLPVGAGVGGS